jgi:type I restriction enzyme S subunit
VIEDLKPYSEYKDSFSPWLGKFPAHWQLPRLGSVLRERGETNDKRKIGQVLSVMKDIGVIPYEEKGRVGNKKSEDTARYKIVRPDDIVVNCMNVIIGSVGLSRYSGCLSPVYYVLTRRSEADNPRYLNAVFQTKPFQLSLVRIGNGIMAHRMRIPMELLKCEPFPVPPSEEQGAIVRFLDHANGRIERAIRAKKNLIALLHEQKQAIIQRVVACGLDPNVPLKPSGIPWLGDIPKHWEVRRIKQTAAISRGKFTHRPRNDPSFYDGPYPFVQTGAVARAKKVITEYKQTLNEKGLAVSKLFPTGTLCMTIAANIGDVAILDFQACFPDSIVGLVPHEGMERDYLFFVLRCMKQEFLLEAPVNTQGNLNVNRIGAMCVPRPPMDEQVEIVRNIEIETKSSDEVINRTEREIELLREYRTRLVSDVVTGKLDVRDAAIKLADENLVDAETGSDVGNVEPEEAAFAEVEG